MEIELTGPDTAYSNTDIPLSIHLSVQKEVYNFHIIVTSLELPWIEDVNSNGDYDTVAITDNGDGTYDAIGNNIIYFRLNYYGEIRNRSNESSITKVEVIKMKTVTSLYQSFINLYNMTEVICPFEETENVTNYAEAWRLCSSLISFPLVDTSSAVDFYATWRNCESMTSFPLLDSSRVTDFRYAWLSCSSLTSFPAINTSLANSLMRTWSGCSSLTSF